jgi:hypothetical protein
MKKLIYMVAFLTLAITFTSNAQRVSATSINAVGDTITFNPMPSKLLVFQATVTKSSGTISGKVYLEGTIDGTWIKMDSLTLSNVTTNSKMFPGAEEMGTSYLGYRFNYVPTGTQTSTLIVAYTRKVD